MRNDRENIIVNLSSQFALGAIEEDLLSIIRVLSKIIGSSKRSVKSSNHQIVKSSN